MPADSIDDVSDEPAEILTRDTRQFKIPAFTATASNPQKIGGRCVKSPKHIDFIRPIAFGNSHFSILRQRRVIQLSTPCLPWPIAAHKDVIWCLADSQ